MPDVNSFETQSHSFIPCCRQLTNGTKKRAGENLTTEDVRNWIYLLEQTLTLSSWLKLTLPTKTYRLDIFLLIATMVFSKF